MLPPDGAPLPCSCESGIVRSAIGMLGKVWSSGALAVVQNVAIVPTSVHPRSKLDGQSPTVVALHHAHHCRLLSATLALTCAPACVTIWRADVLVRAADCAC
jgi:hypothetical protein